MIDSPVYIMIGCTYLCNSIVQDSVARSVQQNQPKGQSVRLSMVLYSKTFKVQGSRFLYLSHNKLYRV